MKTEKIMITALIGTGLLISGSAFADEIGSGAVSSSGSVITETGVTVSTGTIVSTGSDIGNVTGSGYISCSLSGCTTGTIKDDLSKIKENRDKMMLNWGQFHVDNGFIKKFLITPKNKKTFAKELNTALKNYQAALKDLIKGGQDSMKDNTFDPVTFNAKAKEVMEAQIIELSKYVEPAKMDEFKKFMESRLGLLLTNESFRKENFQLRQEIKEIKKSVFSDAQRKALAQKLASKEKAFLTRLVQVIDQYKSKVKTEKVKAQLDELKEITQEQMNLK